MAYLVMLRTLCLVVGIALLMTHSFAFPKAFAMNQGKEDSMKERNDFNQKIMYKRLVSGENYIKLNVRAIGSGRYLNMVVDNYLFASFLAAEHGLRRNDLGSFIDADVVRKFIDTEYVPYMINNEGKIIDVDLLAFERFIERSQFGEGARKDIKKYIYDYFILIFDKPMTLADLQVEDGDSLVKTFFEDNPLTGTITLKEKYIKMYNTNSSFIALLLDLGYIVGHMDIVPILFIRKDNKMEQMRGR